MKRCPSPALLYTALLALTLASTACQPSPTPHEYLRPKMGTVFRIVIYAADAAKANSAAEAAFRRVDELNATFSDYDPNSELSRLSQRTNDGPMTEPTPVSQDLWNVISVARAASERSDGAFDITVGPLVRLWRRSREMMELPTPERIAEAKKSVGYDAIRLFPGTCAVQLTKPRMRLDVGGIAKGYTASQCLRVIRDQGFPIALFGAAGDLTVGDPPPGQPYWRVAVQDAANPTGPPAGYVRLRNQSISTSGDTERYVIIAGVRYSHIVDPHTGLGLTRRIGATVISPEGITSDWMTKPCCILGPQQALPLIEATPSAAARIVTIEDNKPHIYESTRWRNFLLPPEENGREGAKSAKEAAKEMRE